MSTFFRSTTDQRSRPARVFAFWLLLLVPAIPVEQAFGALACAHMEAAGTAVTDAGMHAMHGGAPPTDDGSGADAHMGCTWLGPCSALVAMHSDPATAPTFLAHVLQQHTEWGIADIDLPHPLAYLRPRANAPPAQI